MGNKILYHLLLFLNVLVIYSCNQSKKISSAAYYDYEKTIDSIQQTYNTLYAQRAFSLEFNDKPFNDVSIAIQTDSIKYIYQFEVTEERITDTLKKYKLNISGVTNLIRQMKSIHCTWLDNLVYYENEKKKTLTYVSLRPAGLNSSFSYGKYFIIAYFEESQYFDMEGRLLVGKEPQKMRKINDEIFRRINDKVCYTVSKKFR